MCNRSSLLPFLRTVIHCHRLRISRLRQLRQLLVPLQLVHVRRPRLGGPPGPPRLLTLGHQAPEAVVLGHDGISVSLRPCCYRACHYERHWTTVLQIRNGCTLPFIVAHFVRTWMAVLSFQLITSSSRAIELAQ